MNLKLDRRLKDYITGGVRVNFKLFYQGFYLSQFSDFEIYFFVGGKASL